MRREVTGPAIPRDTERALLGSALAWGDILDGEAAAVRGQHFGVAQHGRLWELLRRLRGEGRTWLDVTSMLDVIGVERDLDAAKPYGGLQYLLALPMAASVRDGVPGQVRVVLEGHARRTVYVALCGALEAVVDPERDPGEVAATVAELARDVAVVDHDEWETHADAMVRAAEAAGEASRTGQYRERFTTSIPAVDEVLYLRRGQLVVLAGRPGTGKSAAVLQMADHIAEYHGAVGILSLEMDHDELGERSLARESGVPLGRISQGVEITQTDLRHMATAVERARGIPLYVDQGTSASVGLIRAKVERLRRKRPDLAAVVVDYLQLMREDAGREAGSENERLSVMTRDLKLMAKELRILVLLLSQLNRESEKGGSQEPRASQLRGSGSIEQDADAIVLLWAPPGGGMSPTEGKVQWNIAKQRKGPKGARVLVAFDGVYQRFGDRRVDARVYDFKRGPG